jgi:large subunit ribosomal protein L13
MKTFSAKASEVSRKWWLIDAKDQVLGRVEDRAGKVLRGE